MFLSRLCLRVRSPPKLQTKAWSPKQSKTPPAAGALDILFGKGDAKPTAEHANKETWVIVKLGCF